MPYLAIVRHGQSQANLDGTIAGQLDSPLTELGHQQAKDIGCLMSDLTFHYAHASTLERAYATMEEILAFQEKQPALAVSDQLREMNYGIMQGKHKPLPEEYTQETQSWFEWNNRPPKGESTSEASARIVTYFKNAIHPQLKTGGNVLLVAHEGILATLQGHLEHIGPEGIREITLNNCEVKIYHFDENGEVTSIEKRRAR